MTTAQLPRVFRYNSVELEDPGLEHDPVDVRNLYSATYPEITSAAIEGPEVKDGKRVYTFRKAVGTKGAHSAQRSDGLMAISGVEYFTTIAIAFGLGFLAAFVLFIYLLANNAGR